MMNGTVKYVISLLLARIHMYDDQAAEKRMLVCLLTP